MLEKLEHHELAIRLAFRLLAIALLALIAWRVEEAVDTAWAAYVEAKEAKDYAAVAAESLEEANAILMRCR
jgi:hypothetical protein